MLINLCGLIKIYFILSYEQEQQQPYFSCSPTMVSATLEILESTGICDY